MKKIYLNLAAGNSYNSSSDWINYDFISSNKSIKRINLLKKLPHKDNSVDFIYCSHFIEHIPILDISFFLNECSRVLKRGSHARFILPDYEKLSREYLRLIDLNKFLEAKFILNLIIDQCVRNKPGGNLKFILKDIYLSKNDDLINFTRLWIGDMYNNDYNITSSFYSSLKKIYQKKNYIWIEIITKFLPYAFLKQNVKKTTIGELHQWLWDYFQLSNLLKENGFRKTEKLDFNKTNFNSFEIQNLDCTSENTPRQGKASLYIEATK